MNPHIKVASPSFSKNDFLRRELQKNFSHCTFNDHHKHFVGQDLIDYLQDCDGAIIGLERITLPVLKKCARLKVIVKYGVGLDNLDLDDCARHGMPVLWTPGVNRRAVAELALGMMLALGKNFYPTSLQLKAGTWNKRGGIDLTGKTVGIIGVGHIGKDLAQLLQPFHCRILANDIIKQNDYYEKHGLIAASKEKILKEADFITLHTPLTAKTRHMIGEAALKRMKKTAFLINTARGAIVQQSALKKALQQNWIAGAGLDVYEEEPPTDSAFLNLPNLLCSPHIGGNSSESVRAMGMSSIENLKKFFKPGKK